MNPAESLDSWGGFRFDANGAHPINRGPYDVGIVVDARNLMTTLIHEVTHRRQRFTEAAQRELVRYRLRAHLDIIYSAMVLEESDEDYHYLRSVAVGNIGHIAQVQMDTVMQVQPMPTVMQVPPMDPTIIAPIQVAVVGTNVGANLPNLDLRSKSVSSINFPPPIDTPALPPPLDGTWIPRNP